MSDKNRDLEFTRSSKNIFDRSVADIDAPTLAELQKRRQNAFKNSTRKNLKWIYYPAGVAACLAIIIFIFTTTPATNSISPDDLDMLSRTESLEFYENLEFYEWLEEYDLST